MSLKDTIQKIAEAFANKPLLEIDQAAVNRELFAKEREQYIRFTETILVAAIDELNRINGIHVQRLYVPIPKDRRLVFISLYGVKFNFDIRNKAEVHFVIRPDPQHPISMEVDYIFNVGTKQQRKRTEKISVDDSVQKIIDIFEEGILKCGPKA